MANFIPPLGGVFKPNSADLASWLYQIWQYLQDNPIANIDELRTLIADTLPAEVATAVAEYLEEHPVEVDYPVDSVNGRTGAVTIDYAELVNGLTVPIYRAANDEFGQNDLLEAYNEGCRFAVQDDSLFFVMLKNNNAITLLPITGGGGGGSSGDGIQSINSTIRPDTNGNVVVTASNLPMSSSNTTTIKSAIEAITPGPSIATIVNTIYPVGSIYISTAAANPADLFTGTQWEAIQGRFLLAASTSHPAGQMDGEETHTLTIQEIPSHTHTIVFENKSLQSGTNRRTPNANYADDTMQTSPAGGGQAHNNMPPYLSVYMWKRTA